MAFSLSDCHDCALRLLARREHSRLELQQKLSARGFPLSRLEHLLNQLESENLLSDIRFAEAYVRSRIQRGFGPLRIQFELRKRGVADNLISTCLRTTSIDWLELAKNQCLKKFGEARASNYKVRAQRARFLQNRGFSKEIIVKVLGARD